MSSRLLEVQSNQVIYRGDPADPLFTVLGDPERSLSVMFAEFSSFGLKVADFRYEDSGPIQDQHVAVLFGLGYCKVTSDRVEANFTNWAPNQIEAIMKAMDATQNAARALAGGMRFASHHFTYYGHVRIEGSTYRDFIKGLPAPVLSSGGESLGTGFNFRWREPNRGWLTSLRLDASLAFPDSMFVSFDLDIPGDELKVVSVGPEVQRYLWAIMNEMGLAFPEQSNATEPKK